MSDTPAGSGSGAGAAVPAGRALRASRRSGVPPFHVMRVLAAAAERAATGAPVFNLTAGQPGTPAPAPVLAAARRSLDTEVLGYTQATGITPLRQAIAGHYARRYGLSVPWRNVVVTTGSSGGFLLAFLAAFDAGDRVAMARPGYPAYRNLLQALGIEVVDLDCGPATRYQPEVAQLAGQDLRGLIVASPANPTGTMLAPAELAGLARYCAAHGIRLISDEIYHGISYLGDRRDSCAWSVDRSGIVANSFSKYFSMTGWRIGWLLVPDDLLDVVDGLAGNLAICPPAPAQYAALAAFDSYDECDAHVTRYARHRELLLNGLAGLGIDRVAPADGAFYVYADIGHLTENSLRFCRDALDAVGVAMAPGVDFDPVEGHRTVRFSFAGSESTITGGLAALAEFLS